VISEVNPSEFVKCSSENICLVINFFVKCLATSCVGSVINVTIDVNLQVIILKCLGYLLRLQKMQYTLFTYCLTSVNSRTTLRLKSGLTGGRTEVRQYINNVYCSFCSLSK